MDRTSPCNIGLILPLICAFCSLLGHPSSGATSPYSPLLKTLGSAQNQNSPEPQKMTLGRSEECLGLHLRGRGMQGALPQALCKQPGVGVTGDRERERHNLTLH